MKQITKYGWALAVAACGVLSLSAWEASAQQGCSDSLGAICDTLIRVSESARRKGLVKNEPEHERIERIIHKVDEATHRPPANVRSRVRSDSTAHASGRAIDVRSRGPRIDQEAARDYSKALPNRYTALVEVPDYDLDWQVNTRWREGRSHRSEGEHDENRKQFHARGTHVHIQADPRAWQRRTNPEREEQERGAFQAQFFEEQFGETVRYQRPALPAPRARTTTRTRPVELPPAGEEPVDVWRLPEPSARPGSPLTPPSASGSSGPACNALYEEARRRIEQGITDPGAAAGEYMIQLANACLRESGQEIADWKLPELQPATPAAPTLQPPAAGGGTWCRRTKWSDWCAP